MGMRPRAAVNDRRKYGRFVSRMKAPCRLTRATSEDPSFATVRNISGKGMGLVANRPIKPGMLLTVELPTEDGTEPRMLRVTHSRPQPGNKAWLLGGYFMKQLSRTELNALKSRSPSIIPFKERRTDVRHTTRIKTACRVVRVMEVGPWQATVRNISERGIGLIANRNFKLGTMLTLEFPYRDHNMSRPRLMKVTHCRAQPGYRWFVLGGAFLTKLTKEEMKALV